MFVLPLGEKGWVGERLDLPVLSTLVLKGGCISCDSKTVFQGSL